MNQSFKKQRIYKNISNNNNKDLLSVQNIFKLKSNQTIICGKHSTLSALNNKNRHLFYLLTTPENKLSWETKIKEIGLSIKIVIKNKDELDLINNYKPHQNIILITRALERISLDEFLEKRLDKPERFLRLIILDQVTDPQNVGAIIRSAHAFKMDGIALSQRNSPQETAAMSKASSGAIEKLDIIDLSNMSREIIKLQKSNFTVYGLTNGADYKISDLEDETGNIAIILGSEGTGLRRLTKEKVDRLITIPISDESESLNVSNAATIAMFQLQKNILLKT